MRHRRITLLRPVWIAVLLAVSLGFHSVALAGPPAAIRLSVPPVVGSGAPANPISGNVTDSQGNPVPGTTIDLSSGSSTFNVVGSTSVTTDLYGSFSGSFASSPATGTGNICATVHGTTYSACASAINVVIGAPYQVYLSPRTVTVGGNVSLTGFASDAAGVRVPGSSLTLVPSAGTITPSTVTTAFDGSFTATLTAPNAAGPVTVTATLNGSTVGTTTVSVVPTAPTTVKWAAVSVSNPAPATSIVDAVVSVTSALYTGDVVYVQLPPGTLPVGPIPHSTVSVMVGDRVTTALYDVNVDSSNTASVILPKGVAAGQWAWVEFTPAAGLSVPAGKYTAKIATSRDTVPTNAPFTSPAQGPATISLPTSAPAGEWVWVYGTNTQFVPKQTVVQVLYNGTVVDQLYGYVAGATQLGFQVDPTFTPGSYKVNVPTASGPLTAPLTITAPKYPISVQGTVLPTSGAPIGGRLYFYADGTPITYLSTPVRSDGNYAMLGLNPGTTYYLKGFETRANEWIHLEGSFTVPASGSGPLNLPLTYLGVTFSGQLKIGGLPVADGWLVARSVSSTPKYFFASVKNGAFNFRLPEGKYQVVGTHINSASGTYEWIPLSTLVTVFLGAADVTAIDIPPVTVTGTVSIGGTPTANVTVVISFIDQAGTRQHVNARTDANGNYALRLAPGTYRTEGIVVNGEWIQVGRPFIFSTSWTENINVPGVTVVGTLWDGANPTGNAWLRVVSSDPKVPPISVRVDSAGKFGMRLTPTQGNTYYTVVGVWVEATRTWISLNEPITNVTATPTQHDISLPAVTFVGQLLYNSAPVKNAWVTVVRQGTDGIAKTFNARTDMGGQFQLRVPLDGTYVLSGYHDAASDEFISLNQPITLSATPTPTLITVPVVTFTGHLLAGTSTSNAPIGGAYLTLKGPNGQTYHSKTAADGTFNFRVNPGTYQVDGYYDNVTRTFFHLTGSVQVTSSTSPTSQDLIAPPQNLSGSLVLVSGGSTFPLPNAWVLVQDAKRNTFRAKTDINGNFAYRLPDGTYSLRGVSTPDGWVDLSAPAITVSGGTTTSNLNSLQVQAVNLTGTLLDQSGTPQADAWVVIKNTDNGTFYRAKTNASGVFKFRLPDGNYVVRAVRLKGAGWKSIKNGQAFKVSGGTTPSLTITP